jgi:hypothetical protein
MLFYLNSVSLGQEWIRIYGSGKHATANYINEDYDKGYFILGSIKTFKYGWIIKTDINGEALWDTKIGNGKYNCIPENIENTGDHGFVISGSFTKYDNVDDPYLMKFNSCAGLEWCKVLRTPGHIDYGQRVKPLSDGGYLFLTRYYGYDPDSRIQLLKFSSTGELIWHQSFTPLDTLLFADDGSDLIITTQNEYLITGGCYYPNPGEPGGWIRPYLIKSDSMGNPIWELPYGVDSNYIGFSASSIENNVGTSFYTVGRQCHTQTGDSPGLIKTSTGGSEQYYKPLMTGTTLGIANTINWFNDTVLIIGVSWSFTNDPGPVGMLKTDTLGNQIKMKEFLNLTNTLYSTVKTFDDKFVSIASDASDGHWKIYAFKVNPDLEYDTIYTHPFVYDSLCPYPIVSDTLEPECDLIVNIDEPFTNPETCRLKVYPNPARDKITIESPKYLIVNSGNTLFQSQTVHHKWQSATIEIYDLFGRRMFSKDVRQGEEELETDVSSWPRGMYVVRLVYNGQTVASEKVVVE